MSKTMTAGGETVAIIRIWVSQPEQLTVLLAGAPEATETVPMEKVFPHIHQIQMTSIRKGLSRKYMLNPGLERVAVSLNGRFLELK